MSLLASGDIKTIYVMIIDIYCNESTGEWGYLSDLCSYVLTMIPLASGEWRYATDHDKLERYIYGIRRVHQLAGENDPCW